MEGVPVIVRYQEYKISFLCWNNPEKMHFTPEEDHRAAEREQKADVMEMDQDKGLFVGQRKKDGRF